MEDIKADYTLEDRIKNMQITSNMTVNKMDIMEEHILDSINDVSEKIDEMGDMLSNISETCDFTHDQTENIQGSFNTLLEAIKITQDTFNKHYECIYKFLERQNSFNRMVSILLTLLFVVLFGLTVVLLING